jgi:transposase
MRKRSTEARNETRERGVAGGLTVGVDVGDRYSYYCVLDGAGGVVEEGRIPTTRDGLKRQFGKCPAMRIALEVGTHSPWASRLLGELGHEVLVANPRRLRMIYQNRSKQDRIDARSLARVARMDPALLSAVEHRPERMAQDLSVLRARDLLVRTRTRLVNHVRGAVKATGNRLRRCSTRRFAEEVPEQMPAAIQEALKPILSAIKAVSEQIRQLDKRVEELCRESYPETTVLRQVPGVGPKVALWYVLTLQSPDRFRRGRAVGAYLGMVPARRQSGEHDPQLRITKEGDGDMRRMLVQAAQYQLGPFGPDCDLKRFGKRLAERGGKNARKRAVVAVARKLAVLLHRLWRTGEVYEPFRQPVHSSGVAPAA